MAGKINPNILYRNVNWGAKMQILERLLYVYTIKESIVVRKIFRNFQNYQKLVSSYYIFHADLHFLTILSMSLSRDIPQLKQKLRFHKNQWIIRKYKMRIGLFLNWSEHLQTTGYSKDISRFRALNWC